MTLSEAEIKNHSVSVIETIVKKMETLVIHSERVDSAVNELHHGFIAHANFVKKCSVKVDSLVNCLKNTNNYLSETIGQFQGGSNLQYSTSNTRLQVPQQLTKGKLTTSVTTFNAEQRAKERRDIPVHTDETAQNTRVNRIRELTSGLTRNMGGIHKSAEPKRRQMPRETEDELRNLIEKYKKKADSRKASLKLLIEVLNGREKEVEQLRRGISRSKELISLTWEEAISLQEQANENINSRLEEAYDRVSGLNEVLEVLQGAGEEANLGQSRKDFTISFGRGPRDQSNENSRGAASTQANLPQEGTKANKVPGERVRNQLSSSQKNYSLPAGVVAIKKSILDEMNSNLAALQSRLRDESKRSDELSLELKLLQTTIAAQSKNPDRALILEQRIADLTFKLSEANVRASEAIARASDLQSQKLTLQEQLRSSEQMNEALRKSLDKKETVRDGIATLSESKGSELDVGYSKISTTKADTAPVRIEELEATKNELLGSKKEVLQLQEKTQSLQKEFHQVKEANDKMERELKFLRDLRDQLEDAVTLQAADNDEAVGVLETQLNEAQNKLDQAARNEVSMKTEMKEKENEAELKTEQLKTLIAECQTKQTAIDQLTQNLRSKDTQIADIVARSGSQSEQTIQKLNEQIKQEQQRYRDLDVKASGYQETSAQASEDVSKLQKDVTRLTTEKYQLIEEASKHRRDIEEEVKNLRLASASFELTLTNREARIKTLEEQLNTADHETAKLQTSLEESKSRLDQAKKLLESQDVDTTVKNRLQVLMEDYDKKMETRLQEVYSDQETTMKKAREEYTLALSKKDSELKEAQKQQTLLQEKLKQQEAELSQAKAEVDSLHQNLPNKIAASETKAQELTNLYTDLETRFKADTQKLTSQLHLQEEESQKVKGALVGILKVLGLNTPTAGTSESLEDIKTEIQNLKVATVEMEGQLKQLKESKAQVDDLNIELNRRLASSSQDHDSLMTNLKSKVQELFRATSLSEDHQPSTREANVANQIHQQLDQILRNVETSKVQQAKDAQNVQKAKQELELIAIERVAMDNKDKLNQSEFARMSSQLIEAKEHADNHKERVERYKQKLAESEKNLLKAQEDLKSLKDELTDIQQQRLADQQKFTNSLEMKLTEINQLNEEVSKLKTKLKTSSDKNEEKIKMLSEQLAISPQGKERSPEDLKAGSPGNNTGRGSQKPSDMEPIRETEDEPDESGDEQANMFKYKIETLQATVKGLKAKLSSLESIFRRKEGVSRVDSKELDQDADTLKVALMKSLEREIELEEYLENAVETINHINAEADERIQNEEAKVAQLEDNLETVEEKYIREIGEKNRSINRFKEEMEEKITAKDREIFYLKKEQESVNVAKNDEIEHLKRVATESSKDDHKHQDSNATPEMSQQDEIPRSNQRLSKQLEETQRLNDMKDEENQRLSLKIRLMAGEIDELKRKNQDSPGISPKDDKESEDPKGELAALKKRYLALEENNKKLKLDLEKELEVRKQFLNDYEYVRTESDYRITNEDMDAMKHEKLRMATESSLLNELANLIETKFHVKKEVNRSNIVQVISKQIDKLELKEGDSNIIEKFDELTISNQQMKKEVESLATQNNHLKQLMLKSKEGTNTVLQNPTVAQAVQSVSNPAMPMGDLINQFLSDLEMKPLERLEPAKVKEAFTIIVRMRKRMLIELKAKDDQIEDLRISSLKVSSDENGHASSNNEDYGRLKELLVKYHNLRRKHESCLAEIEKMQLDKENQEYEVEDLKKSLELEVKRHEAAEIQLQILKKQSNEASSDITEHIRRLFSEYFKALIEGKDSQQAQQVLEYLVSMLGYTVDDKKGLLESVKKNKLIEKAMGKKK